MKTVLFLCTGNYFRSRYAELLFNHLAQQCGLAARAHSAGLEEQCHTRNLGAISRHTLAALLARGIEVRSPRTPCDATAEDLAGADLIVAVKEREHRPLLARRFPGWEERVRYWHVDDIPEVPAGQALGRLEELVQALVDELHDQR